jgi:uncharacterized protein
MLLDLRGFRSGTDEVIRQFAPGAFELAGEDFRIVTPVQLTARLTKDNEKVRLVGRLQTMLEADCGRCLDPLTIPVDANLDVLFLPELDQTHAASAGGGKDDDEAEVREADTGVSFYKNDTIDLGEIMRDEFYLAVPMKPLCRPDCRGLCAVCGVNRNRETCSCRPEWVDPRMEPLKKLLDH